MKASISPCGGRSMWRAPRRAGPSLIQAGSSEDGQDLAAATADVVFTAQRTLPEGQAFYASPQSSPRPAWACA